MAELVESIVAQGAEACMVVCGDAEAIANFSPKLLSCQDSASGVVGGGLPELSRTLLALRENRGLVGWTLGTVALGEGGFVEGCREKFLLCAGQTLSCEPV